MRSLLVPVENCVMSYIRSEGTFFAEINFYTSSDVGLGEKDVPCVSVIGGGSTPGLPDLGIEDGGTHRSVSLNVIVRTGLQPMTDQAGQVFSVRAQHDELVSAVFSLFHKTDLVQVLRGYIAAGYGLSRVEYPTEQMEVDDNGFKTTISTEVLAHADS